MGCIVRRLIHETSYLRWLAETSPGLAREVLGEQGLRDALARWFRDTIAFRIHSPEVLVKYAKACPSPGAEPSDYALREIELGPDTSVLAGIHFQGLEVKQPFVGVFAQSRSLTPVEISQASRVLTAELSLFAPGCVQWWASDSGPDLRALPGGRGDQRLLLGRLDDLMARPQLERPAGIRLVADPNGDSFDWYDDVYEGFFRANPHWRGRLQKTDAALYRECATQGGLHVLEVGGRRAGVIAARPGVVRGVPGWEMIEEVLDSDFRGQGLAPPMQQEFLARLDPGKGELVLGTIDDENHPSLGTARRVGRTEGGGWVFIPPAPIREALRLYDA